VIGLMASVLFVATAYSQHVPPRPPWGDVCCGGPCCLKPAKPKH